MQAVLAPARVRRDSGRQLLRMRLSVCASNWLRVVNEWPMRDMECHLDEDGTAALLYALWSSDDPMYARFVLPTPTTEDAFDPEAYLKLCEHD